MAIDYRPDIDGLRAIAVVPVILYHSGLPMFSGGYVGVDIFFVISGFLITKILLADIDGGRFSILRFYERRVRRIFPALFVVLAASTGVALYILFASELYEFANSLIAGTFFYSNYYFMFDAGYFAAPSETKPLLHIWSLAVEEQFYIAFPIYLFAVTRLRRAWAGVVTVILMLLSLAYGAHLVNVNAADAFYSTPGRSWELLVGAAIALLPRVQNVSVPMANALTATGLGMIVYSILVFSDATNFPGLAAMLPVLGCGLIIATGAARPTVTGTVLSVPAIRFVGLISYSLYLWHWPVLVFYKLWNIGPLTGVEIAALTAVTALLSWLTWKYVETPFRKRQLLPLRRNILTAGVGVMLASGALGVVFLNANGLPGRFPEQISPILDAKRDSAALNECENMETKNGLHLTTCRAGARGDGPPEFAVWGDSHGMALLPAVQQSAAKHRINGVFAGRGGCPPLLGVRQVREGTGTCPGVAAAFLAYLHEHPEIRQVILAGRWSIYAMGERFLEEEGATVYIQDDESTEVSLAENRRVFRRGLERTMVAMAALDLQVVVAEQVPETGFDIPAAVARRSILDREIDFRPSLSQYLERNAFVSGEFDALHSRYRFGRVQPQYAMCDDHYCSVLDGGLPIYTDSSHLTATYAAGLATLFDPLWLTRNGNEYD